MGWFQLYKSDLLKCDHNNNNKLFQASSLILCCYGLESDGTSSLGSHLGMILSISLVDSVSDLGRAKSLEYSHYPFSKYIWSV